MRIALNLETGEKLKCFICDKLVEGVSVYIDFFCNVDPDDTIDAENITCARCSDEQGK